MVRSPLLLAALIIPSVGSAQQIVEVDYSAGRTIIDDEWRAMRHTPVIADWDRDRLYVHDPQEPNGVMVFSLETGEHVATIPAPRGDGPFEFSQGWRSMALADDGGLHVSGNRRVVTYDSNYQPITTWTPQAPPRWAVCDLGGKPAVPTRGGVLRYEAEAIGPSAVVGDSIMGIVRSEEEMITAGYQFSAARLVCTDDSAFAIVTYGVTMTEDRLLSHSTAADSVFIFRLDGTAGRISLPTEYTEAWGCTKGGRPCPPWTAGLSSALDDRENITVFSADLRIGGAIINPETGCYAIIRKDTEKFSDRHLLPVAVRADSVLVFEQDRGATTTYMGSAVKASLHPVRTVSGEPCAGMLSSP